MKNNIAESERQAFTISEFCGRNGISACTYHRLKQQGLVPREMRMRNAIRISIEAERDWRAARETPNDTEARLMKREAEARKRSARNAARASTNSPKHISKPGNRAKAKG